jgi:hypothetical protein
MPSLSVLKTKHRKKVANYYEETDEKGRALRIAITDIDEIWRRIQFVTGDKVKRVGRMPFIVLPSGEIRELKSATDMFAYLFKAGALLDWIDKVPGAISKAEMYQYVGLQAERYETITNMPHFPPLPDCYYCIKVAPERNGKLDQLIEMFNYANEADKILLKSLFMTPFWGGPGGSRPAFLLDGIDNDGMGNRGIGKTSVTDALSLLCGDCLDISRKTDGDDVRKLMLTSGDVRLVRMDNIKAGNLSNDVFESLITTKRVSGHKLYVGHASVPNWFTFVMTFNDASLSRDMSQRTMVVRLKRPRYDANWFPRIVDFIEKNRGDILSDIAASIQLDDRPDFDAKTRFPLWEKQVLSGAAPNLDCVYEHITNEQGINDSDAHLLEDIREVIESHLCKFIRPHNTKSEWEHLNPATDYVAIPRSELFRWIAPLFGTNASRRYVAKKFNSLALFEFCPQVEIYCGDRYLIRCPFSAELPPLVHQKRPKACHRIPLSSSERKCENWSFQTRHDLGA